ncbi:MAG: AsmA family protein [Victivallales bacterium]|nr:AsmA family protein [Victivallales bacterium]
MTEKQGKRKSHWGRNLAIGLGVILALLVVLVLVVSANLGRIARKALLTWGPELTGTDIQVGDIDISLLRGELKVTDLVIGNPEGYNTPSILEISEMHVKMDVMSAFSDVIRIRLIEIKSPKVTYEVGLGNSNVGTLLDRLTKAEEAEEANEDSEEEGKRVVIDQVNIEDGSIHLAAKITQGHALPIPLPDIHLSDIGKTKEELREEAIARGENPDEGASVLDATCEILGSIFNSSLDAVKSGAGVVVEGVKGAADAAVDKVKGIFGGDK